MATAQVTKTERGVCVEYLLRRERGAKKELIIVDFKKSLEI
ncbi:MAG: hypothetical protein NT007_09855 [Candidatus Kapabacteria bacterium]|nr:hypothetical protein [Candidatus Kapabacteria bacterium]